MRGTEVKVAFMSEDCNCYQNCGRIQHNNGGNYHQREKVMYDFATQIYTLWQVCTYEDDEWRDSGRICYSEWLAEATLKDGHGWELTLYNFEPRERSEVQAEAIERLQSCNDRAVIFKVAALLGVTF